MLVPKVSHVPKPFSIVKGERIAPERSVDWQPLRSAALIFRRFSQDATTLNLCLFATSIVCSTMTVDLYPSIIYEGDLSPNSFGSDVDDICNEIHAACKGFGTNEKRLVQALGATTGETRTKVSLRYKELFDKELRDVIKSECGNKDFGTVLQLLSVNPVETDCILVEKASQGLGTKEELLYTIVCGRSNRDIELLKKKYFELYTNDLGRVLDSELGGDFEKLIFNVIQAAEQEYDPEFHTEEKIENDAKELFDMGQGRWGTNEAGLYKLLCASPPEYLKKLNLLYADKYGFTLTKALETELNGLSGDAARFMVGMKLKPMETVAELIHKACKGVGTNELLLASALIRYQSILNQVNLAYIELYSETIEDRIKSETRGDYEALLLQILGSAN